MGFMSMIKGLFGGKSGAPVMREGRTYVVDGARLFDEKTGRRLGTREQLQLLNKLGQVAKAEKLQMHVVLESEKPLREVDAKKGEYNGVGVTFVKDSEELIETALKLTKKTKGAVLVSSGPNLESRATEAKLTILTSSTFRKAYLANGIGGNGGNNGGNGGQRKGGGERRGGNEARRDGGRRGGRGGGDRRRNGSGGRGAAAPAAVAAAAAAAPAPAAGGAEAPAAAAPAGAPAAAPAAVNSLLDTVE